MQEIQFRRTLFSQQEVVLKIAIPIDSPTCFVTTRYFQFTVPSCRTLKSNQAVSVFGSVDKGSDGGILERKRLTIADIKPYVLKRHSLNDWKLYFQHKLQRVRLAIFSLLQEHVSSYQVGLVIALLFGNTEWLVESIEPYFKTTGTLHILAASGQNVSLILLMIEPLIPAATSFKVKGLLLLLACVGYLVVVGLQPSLTRASVMAGLLLISRYFCYCQYNALYTLLISVPLLLLFRPEWSVAIGFWLSVCATLGIIVLFKVFQDCFNTFLATFSSFFGKNIFNDSSTISSYIIESLAAGVAAQAVTFPLLFTQFGTVQLLSFIPTTFVGWLVPIIITYTILTACLLSLISTFQSLDWLSNAVSFALVWVPSDLFIHLLKLLSSNKWGEMQNPWYVSPF